MRARVGVAVALVALAVAAPAQATTFVVTRTDDPSPGACDSDCSLREAVLAVDAGAGGDTIQLPAGHFRLTIAGVGEDAAATGDLDLTKSVTISGAGARSTTVDAAGDDRVFDVASGVTALVSDMTVTGGLVSGNGAGIRSAGALTLVRDTIRDNETLTSGDGGGVESTGTLALTQSTVAGNHAHAGGGIHFAGSAAITSSTVSGNVATAAGGGVAGGAGLSVASGTIADNVSLGGAGSGGGLGVVAPALRNTIVAGNVSHPGSQSATALDNCSSPASSGGNNLSDGSDCGLTASGDRQGVPVRLGPLADNGGPTDTEAVLPGSAALDAGAGCPVTDQRGAPRPRGAACDIGAYEVAPPAATTSPARSLGLTSALLAGTVDPDVQLTSYRFDYGTTSAYGAQTPLQWLAPGASITVTAFVPGLRPGTTYHFRLVASNADGTSTGADVTFTTLDRTPPVLSLLRVAPGIFRAAKGTSISFTLSEAASVTFKVDHVVLGVRRGKSCVAKTRRRRGRPCTRYLPVKGSLTQAGRAGPNKLHFDALVGGRRLRPGAYRLDAKPRDAAGNLGKTVVAAFRVVR